MISSGWRAIAALAVLSTQVRGDAVRAELEARLQKAREERFRGQTSQALEELKTLLSSIRGRPEFRDLEWNAESEMSEAYLKQGDPALAAACLNGMVKQKPEDKPTQYKLGMLDRDLGDQRQATEHLRIAVEGGYNNLAARVNLIEAAFQAKQSALAVRTATQLLDIPVRSVPVLLRVGDVLFDHLFYRQALKAFEKAREASPETFEPRFRAALTSYLLEGNDAVVAKLQNDISASPEAASLVASAKAKLGQFHDAEAILRKTIERSPQNPHAYINLALIELDQGRRPEGEALLEQLAAIKTGAKVFYTMKRNDCGEIATNVQTRSAELDPAPAKAAFYYEWAVQLERGSNYLSAAELIHLAWLHGEKSAQSLYVAAESCLNQDPLSAAPVLLLRRAIRADSNFAQAYYLLGRACVRQGQIDQAAQAFKLATELKSDPDYYVSLGKTLKTRAEARAAYEQALKIDGSNAPAHLELGRAFLEDKEFDKAKPELEKALDLEPDFYEAAYLLGRLYHLAGDEQRSRKYMAEFAGTKKALLEQSVIGAGYLGDGR